MYNALHGPRARTLVPNVRTYRVNTYRTRKNAVVSGGNWTVWRFVCVKFLVCANICKCPHAIYIAFGANATAFGVNVLRNAHEFANTDFFLGARSNNTIRYYHLKWRKKEMFVICKLLCGVLYGISGIHSLSLLCFFSYSLSLTISWLSL